MSEKKETKKLFSLNIMKKKKIVDNNNNNIIDDGVAENRKSAGGFFSKKPSFFKKTFVNGKNGQNNNAIKNANGNLLIKSNIDYNNNNIAIPINLEAFNGSEQISKRNAHEFPNDTVIQVGKANCSIN